MTPEYLFLFTAKAVLVVLQSWATPNNPWQPLDGSSIYRNCVAYIMDGTVCKFLSNIQFLSRYHINNNFGNDSAFNEEMVRFVCAEMASALDYLRSKNIVHRDVKPDNILLDELGHSHLTDFNVATYLNDEYCLKNMAGTKPYMAPEIFKVCMCLI